MSKHENITIMTTTASVKGGKDIMEGIVDAIRLCLDTKTNVVLRGGDSNEVTISYNELIDPIYSQLVPRDED